MRLVVRPCENGNRSLVAAFRKFPEFGGLECKPQYGRIVAHRDKALALHSLVL